MSSMKNLVYREEPRVGGDDRIEELDVFCLQLIINETSARYPRKVPRDGAVNGGGAEA